MKNVAKILTYLKDNEEVMKIISKQCDFDLEELVNSNYKEIPSSKKRLLENKFVELGLLEKEKVERERRSNLRVDDISHYYYNYEQKMKYLEEHQAQYKEETKRVFRVLFRKTSEMEKELGKDLYDFNMMELEQLLKSLKITTLRSVQNTVSMIGNYIDYGIDKKLASVKENLVYSFSLEENAMKVVDLESSEKMYLSRDDVMYMAMESINAQDGVILALLHDGFSHKNNFKELINLEIKDIDWDREVAVIKSRDEKNNEIKLSKETIFLLKESIDNDEYLSTNEDSNVVRIYRMQKSKYVLRGLRAKEEDVKISWRNINQRILRQAEYFGNEFLTGTNIVVSSQIDTAYEAFNNDKSIGDRAIRYALEKYNYPYNRSSLYALKKKVDIYKKVHIS